MRWPEDDAQDAPAWLAAWAKAFDKEPLTRDFFKRFDSAIDAIKSDLEKYQGLKPAEAYTRGQLLLERLIFLYFLQNRGWLNQQRDYLLGNFQPHRERPDEFSYYQESLEKVFWALASPPRSAGRDLPGIPFLNGGLFDDDEFEPSHVHQQYANRFTSDIEHIHKKGLQLHRAKKAEQKRKLRLDILDRRLEMSRRVLEAELKEWQKEHSLISDTLFSDETETRAEKRKRIEQETEHIQSGLKKLADDRKELDRLTSRDFDNQFYPKLRRLEGADFDSPFNFAWQIDFADIFASRNGNPVSTLRAQIATHGHFVFDSSGAAFNEKAPLLKLSTSWDESQHHLLAGLLNSSAALFWLKQVCFNKGAGDEEERDRFEFGGGKVQQLPVPELIGSALEGKSNAMAEAMTQLSRDCWEHGKTLSSLALKKLFETNSEAYHDWNSQLPGYVEPHQDISQAFTTPDELRQSLARATEIRETLRSEMIARQEEMDWLAYEAYGLIDVAHAASLRDLVSAAFGNPTDSTQNDASQRRALPDDASQRRALPDDASQRRALPDDASQRRALPDDASQRRALPDDASQRRALPDDASQRRALPDDASQRRALPDDASQRRALRLQREQRPFCLWAAADADFDRAVALIPDEWTNERKQLWKGRLELIRDNEHIRRIEQPVYKRRWDEQWKVGARWQCGQPAYDQEFLDAFTWWLSEKAEWWLEKKSRNGAATIEQWAGALWNDPRVQAAWFVAAEAIHRLDLWKREQKSKPTGSLPTLDASPTAFSRFFKATVKEQTVPEGIPFAVPYEKIRVNVPAQVKKIRGKLNVPRERFRVNEDGLYRVASFDEAGSGGSPSEPRPFE